MTDPQNGEAWRSYLMPDTNTLRTLAGFTDPVAAALFERITSVDAETTLRTTVDRRRSFDLAHLQDIHRRLFGDVYEWAGQLRYVDLGKPDQTGEPFLHHRWITAYSSAVTDHLQADAHLARQSDPGVWADRAAHYWAALLHAHPFREGNGRSIRIWLDDLADAAGHHLRWERSCADRTVFVAAAARTGDLEPMRALLTQLADGTLGVDRPVDALDDLHKLQHALAWTRVGLAFGTHDDREQLGPRATDVTSRIGAVRRYLDTMPTRATTHDQPAEHRWRGLAASLHPDLPQAEDWPQFAAELDSAVTAGIDVAGDLHRIVSDLRQVAKPAPPPAPIAGRAQPKPLQPKPSRPTSTAPPPPGELAAAGYYRQPPPLGPRR